MTVDFADWFSANGAEIKRISTIATRQKPPEAEMGPEAWYQILTDSLSDILGRAFELRNTAEEYWLIRAAKDSEGIEGKPKTALDYAKNMVTPERRVYRQLEALVDTINTRISATQSLLRSMKV